MMIKNGISAKKCEKRKQVFYGIPVGSHGVAELLSYDLVNVAKQGHHFVAVPVFSDSDPVLKENPSTDGCSESCSGILNMSQVCLAGPISRGSSIRKVLKKVAKHCAAVVVIVGTTMENTPREFAGCCTKQLPVKTAVLAVCKGKIIFGRCLVYQLQGFRLHSRPRFCLCKNPNSLTDAEVPVAEETGKHSIQTSKKDGTGDGTEESREGKFSLEHDHKAEAPLSSICLLLKELPESTLGWPLQRRAVPMNQEALARDMSVVQRGMSLPNRSTSKSAMILENQVDFIPNGKADSSFGGEIDNSMLKEHETKEVDSQTIGSSEDKSAGSSRNQINENLGPVSDDKGEVLASSVSFPIKELRQSVLGWPLLQIAASTALKALRESKENEMSVVQWVMNLPNRSTPVTLQTRLGFGCNIIGNTIGREINDSGPNCNKNYLAASRTPPKELDLLLKSNSSGCRWFSYEELKTATSQFSPENLIGEGGCSSVYKGYLPSGKLVAVKISKSYKEAWDDFSLEVDIISSLKHKHITPLVGVCIEDDYLISVYDFLPKGSLEENLHGNNEKFVLPWDVRFKVAIVVAEALNYLHNECSRPVIHRDVKSSNILLSNEFQPQCSDFGLAIWGPTDSNYIIHTDVVGTFGYIAPEYFMHGRVSEKIDVYSFGVVLLELLSGRRPIGSKNLKGQESLVKWAKPLLNTGDLKALVDPKLDGAFDAVQLHRMVLVASLCINQSHRLRPKASQILKLLRGENDAEEWVKSHVDDLEESGSHEDDELYVEYDSKPHFDLAFLGVDDDTASLVSKAKGKSRFSFEDFLKGRHS